MFLTTVLAWVDRVNSTTKYDRAKINKSMFSSTKQLAAAALSLKANQQIEKKATQFNFMLILKFSSAELN